MQHRRKLRAALGIAVVMVATGCGPGPSGPPSAPWIPFTVGANFVQGDGPGVGGATTADGTVFAFASAATNLVPGDTNNAVDVFVRDAANGTTTRIMEGTTGVPFISADGRFVSIGDSAKVFDRQSGTLLDVGVRPTGPEGTALVNTAGTEAVFGARGSAMFPGTGSCWIRPLNLGPAVACNPDPTAATAFLSASADLDRIVVEVALAPNPFPNAYVALIDRSDGTITPLTGVSAAVAPVVISRSGRYLAWSEFVSSSSQSSTIKVLDTQTSSVATFSPTAVPDAVTIPNAISDDGHTVVGYSMATNLVPGDTNGGFDLFRMDVTAGTASRISRTQAGAQLSVVRQDLPNPGVVDGSFTHAVVCTPDSLSSFDTNSQIDCTLVPI